MTSSTQQHHSQLYLTEMPHQPFAPVSNSVAQQDPQNSKPLVQVFLPHHQAAIKRPGNSAQEGMALSSQINVQGYLVRDHHLLVNLAQTDKIADINKEQLEILTEF
jgi:hypothetical protein